MAAPPLNAHTIISVYSHTGEKTKDYSFVRLHTDSIFPYFKRSVKHNDAALVLMHERHKLWERLYDLTTPSPGPCAREPRALRVAQVVIVDLEFDGETVHARAAWLQDEEVGRARFDAPSLERVRRPASEEVGRAASLPADEQPLPTRPAHTSHLKLRLGLTVPLPKVAPPASTERHQSSKPRVEDEMEGRDGSGPLMRWEAAGQDWITSSKPPRARVNQRCYSWLHAARQGKRRAGGGSPFSSRQ